MVLHVNPVSHVQAVAIQWQVASFKRIRDHERDELLRKLERSEIITAAGYDNGQFKCSKVCECKQIARSFRRAVWRARLHGKVLSGSAVWWDRPVDLIRRDDQHPLNTPNPGSL